MNCLTKIVSNIVSLPCIIFTKVCMYSVTMYIAYKISCTSLCNDSCIVNYITALQRTEESAKQLEDQMKLAEEEARDLERKKQEAEEEKERVRKEIESQKEQSEAAVRIYLIL